ncbi:MAG: HD domain-containing phosphohydrolase [Thermodesulfobacteriota bacterium]|nr:HD domain-containing phosphohydrolase [Thermodesulfobacteriota bacterium]
MAQKNPQEDLDISRLSADKKLGHLLESVVREVKLYAEGQIEHIQKLAQIGLALSGQKNLNTLLEMIVDEARKLSGADAGTLYIVEQKSLSLRFAIFQNDSMNIRKGGAGGDLSDEMPNVPLADEQGNPNHANVSSYVALTGESVNIEDVYETGAFDFSGTKRYDAATGYRCKSMLVMPLKNHEDKIIGVLQLLNAKDPQTGEIVKFHTDIVDLVASLASQAAIALTNTQLIEDLKALFYAFIKSIATAIDAKSSFTGEHINRVVSLTMDVAEAIHGTDSGPFSQTRFTDDEMEELRIAAWMHDVGKITTPEHIVSKTNKLEGIFDRIHLIETRFLLILQLMENRHLRVKIDLLKTDNSPAALEKMEAMDRELQARKAGILESLELLKAVNTNKGMVDERAVKQVREIAARTYHIGGNAYPWLSENEAACLSILKGNLLDEERRLVEQHAEMTINITRELPFPDRFSHVPEYAGAHHEKLDGSGYPLGLAGDQIPLQARIIAIADVFEALTAPDRPYKRPMHISQALKILQDMAAAGHIDGDIVRMFIEQKVYQAYADKKLAPEQLSTA